VLDLIFIIHQMPDESYTDETCKSHITLVQLLNFILYYLCNFPVFVSVLHLNKFPFLNDLSLICLLFYDSSEELLRRLF